MVCSYERRGHRKVVGAYKPGQHEYEGDVSRCTSRHPRRSRRRLEFSEDYRVWCVTHDVHGLYSLIPPQGSALFTQLSKAIKMRAKHVALLDKFTKRFKSDTVDAWRRMINEWDADTSKPCPYQEPVIGMYVSCSNRILLNFEYIRYNNGSSQQRTG
jgi:hypothetical protein